MVIFYSSIYVRGILSISLSYGHLIHFIQFLRLYIHTNATQHTKYDFWYVFALYAHTQIYAYCEIYFSNPNKQTTLFPPVVHFLAIISSLDAFGGAPWRIERWLVVENRGRSLHVWWSAANVWTNVRTSYEADSFYTGRWINDGCARRVFFFIAVRTTQSGVFASSSVQPEFRTSWNCAYRPYHGRSGWVNAPRYA